MKTSFRSFLSLAAIAVAAQAGYQVDAHPVATTPPPEAPVPGAIASWGFDEGAGDTLHDRTGNGHDGVIHGARWVDGMRGKALAFSGEEWVEVPGDSATNVKSFTFSIWLKQSGNGFRVPLMEFHEPNAPVGVHLWANTSGWGNNLPGAFYANLRPHDASHSQPSSVRERNLLNTGAGSAQGGRWNHVVLVLDHAALKARIYVNGKLCVSRALDPFLPRTTGSLFLGMRTPTSQDGDADVGLVGLLDQADLFGRALTEAEILALYDHPPVEAEGIHLGIKTHHAKAGDTLWVPVYISSTGKDSIASLQFKLEYDTSVAQLLDVKADTGLAEGWQVQDWNRQSESPVAIALAGTSRLVGAQEGELLRLKLRLLPGLREGASTQLTLKEPLADEGRVQSLSVAPGRIFVLPAGIVYGDVTGDGEVERLDAQTILRHVVGELPLPSEDFPAFTVAVADVSGNGRITAYDAALVLHFALGILEEFPVQAGPKAGVAAKRTAQSAAAGRLSVSGGPAEGGVWRYRIQAEGLTGLMGGELSFEALGGVTSIVRVSSPVAGMRATYRFDPATRRLDIALAGNRRLAASGSAVEFLEVEAAYPATTSARGLTLLDASLNEGSLAVGGTVGNRMSDDRSAASRAGLRLAWDGGGLRFEVPGHSLAAVEILDVRGRRVTLRRYDSPVAAGYLSRSGLPAGLLVLRATGKDGTWTQILPSVAP